MDSSPVGQQSGDPFFDHSGLMECQSDMLDEGNAQLFGGDEENGLAIGKEILQFLTGIGEVLVGFHEVKNMDASFHFVKVGSHLGIPPGTRVAKVTGSR